MNKELANKDFREVKKILDRLRVEFFLVCGSALWAYRDNEFPGGGSQSIGIGIFGRQDVILGKLIEHNFRMIPDRRTKKIEDIDTILRFKKNVETMIYFFEEDGQYWRTYLDSGYVRPYVYFPIKFSKLEKIKFKGMVVNVPSPIEEYLLWTYGRKWRDKSQKNKSYPPAQINE